MKICSHASSYLLALGSFAGVEAFGPVLNNNARPSSSVPFLKNGLQVANGKPMTIRQMSSSSVKTQNRQEQISGTSNDDEYTPDMQSYSKGYSTVFSETVCKTTAPINTLPSDLVGTYFRSGPAMYTAGAIPPPKGASAVQPKSPPVSKDGDLSRMVRHPFDADGGVVGITFHGGEDGNQTVTFRYRYIRTAGYAKERKKGSRLYTGMDGTRETDNDDSQKLGNDFPLPFFKHHLEPGLNRKRKNTGNTRSIFWGNKLLSLWEGGLPYKLDGLGLSTEGKSQLGGIIASDQSSFGGSARYDANKNRMLFYSNKQGDRSSMLTLFEFNAKFRLAVQQQDWKLEGMAVLSDLGVTKDYVVLIQPSVKVNGMQYMMSKEPSKTLKVEQDTPALVNLIPRREGASQADMKTFTIPTDDYGVDADVQIINSYQDGNTIIIDGIRSSSKHKKPSKAANTWPWATTTEEYKDIASKKSLWRYTVNTDNGKVSKECMSDLQVCFGVMNPLNSAKEHKYVYATVGGMGEKVAPPQGIVKFDVETRSSEVWLPKPHEFCGEPMYAPRKGEETSNSDEDNGYILSLLFNGQTQTSEIIVFAANDIASGPISRVPLDVAIPHGYHGCFSPGGESKEDMEQNGFATTVWSADEIERRAKLFDKMEARGNNWNEVKSDFSGLGLRLDDFEEYFGDIL